MLSGDHRDILTQRLSFGVRTQLCESPQGNLRIGRNMLARLKAADHVQLENPRNHDDRLRSVPILEHREFQGFSAIDEKTAAEALLILHDPMAVAVLSYAE
jgi:hypothetical protein